MLWTDTKESLDEFIKQVNNIHKTIKFEIKTSTTEIEYLDTITYIKDGRLMHKLYRKPTDRQAYLHNSSYHPNSTKREKEYHLAKHYESKEFAVNKRN